MRMHASPVNVLRACALTLAAATCGFLSAAACVGDTGSAAHPSGEPYGAGDDLDAGYADVAVPLEAEAAACSAALPEQGTPCRADGSVCEYGSAFLLQCNTLARCAHGTWQISAPDAGTVSCGLTMSDACPASLNSVAQLPTPQACAPLNLDCDYPEGRCECAQNLPRTPGAPAVWKCPSPVAFLQSCPPVRPRLGTACPPYTRCDYGACDIQGATAQQCLAGIWVEQTVDCYCPSMQPKAGDACSRFGLTCEYGSSNLASCNTQANCSAIGLWAVAMPEGGPPCVSAPANECPDAGQAIQGLTCTTPGLDCDYGSTRCECNSGPAAQSETTWRCDYPALAGPGCGLRPRLGAPCIEQGLECDYGSCEIQGGGAVTCADYWAQAGTSCGVPPAPPGLPPGVHPPPIPGTTCPAEPPQTGNMCFARLTCEYGSSPVASCDTIATCGSSFGAPAPAWVLTPPDAGDPACMAAPPSECPASFAAVPRGTECAGGSSACDYPEGRCRCAAAPGFSTAVWSCQDPPTGCPRPRPRLGISCVQEGLVCPYESCGTQGSQTEMCLGGFWTPLTLDCTADAGFESTSASGARDSSPGPP